MYSYRYICIDYFTIVKCINCIIIVTCVDFIIIGDPYSRNFSSRFSIWKPQSNQRTSSSVCEGQWVRDICVFGSGDLPRLYNRSELFANKLFMENDIVAYDCMEELALNRTLDELTDLAELRRLNKAFHKLTEAHAVS